MNLPTAVLVTHLLVFCLAGKAYGEEVRPSAQCTGESCFTVKGIVGNCEYNEYLQKESDEVGLTGVELTLLTPTWTEVACRGEKALAGKRAPAGDRVWMRTTDESFCPRLRGKIVRGNVSPVCADARASLGVETPELPEISEVRW